MADTLNEALREITPDDGSGTPIVVTSDLRTLVIPNNIHVIGVVTDEKTNIIYFSVPRYSKTFDLSAFSISIIFKNALGNLYYHPVSSNEITLTEDSITFFWIPERVVYAKAGNVTIALDFKLYENGNVTREWNTTTGSLQVEDTLADGAEEVNVEEPETIYKIVNDYLETLDISGGGSGSQGPAGKSAYQIAIDNGFSGTEQQWLASLKGEPGINGKSAYELAVQNGFSGTLAEWLESLKGEPGESGGSGDTSFTSTIAQDILNLFLNAAYTNNSVATALQKYATDAGLSIPVTSITLDKNTTTIAVGETETITTTTLPNFATNANNIVWTSSDNSIATVSNGVITGIASGSVTVTATIGSVSASCAVTVNSIPVETHELLHSFDFTESLTDSVGNVTAMLYNGNTRNPTRDSNGLTFDTLQQCADYGQIYGRDRTYVIDLGECTYDQTTYGDAYKIYARLFVVDTDTDTGVGGSGFIFCSNVSASRYGWSWYMYGDGWQPSAMIPSGSTAADLATCKSRISNKTMHIYVDADGYASVYIDGELIGTTTKPIPVYNNGHVYSGSISGNDTLYTTVIRGLRVYDGKVMSE